MNINVTDMKLDAVEAACEIVIVVAGDLDHRWVRDRADLETLSFIGESEEAAFLPHQHRVYVGADSLERDEIRLAVAKAIRTLEKSRY